MPELPAITIRNPYAFAIAEAAALAALGVEPKSTENRGRKIPEKYLGQDIAIHAGLAWSDGAEYDERIRRAWSAFSDAFHPQFVDRRLADVGDRRTGLVGDLRKDRNGGLWMPSGAVVAVARLVDCHPAEQPLAPDATCCWPWGEREHNGKPAVHIVLDNIRRLRGLVEERGSLSLPWKLSPEKTAEVLGQITERSTA